jgi:hypothetical protein
MFFTPFPGGDFVVPEGDYPSLGSDWDTKFVVFYGLYDHAGNDTHIRVSLLVSGAGDEGAIFKLAEAAILFAIGVQPGLAIGVIGFEGLFKASRATHGEFGGRNVVSPG